MRIKRSSTDIQRHIPKPGLVRAVCVDVIDLGDEEVTWQGQSKGFKPKLKLAWEIEEIHPEFGGPCRIYAKYTASLNEKSRLYSDLISWRGVEFTPEELEDFDMANLIGVPCMLQIIHRQDTKGTTWANVNNIMPMPQGMGAIAPSGEYTRAKDREDWQEPYRHTEEAEAQRRQQQHTDRTRAEDRSANLPFNDRAPEPVQAYPSNPPF